MCVDEVPGVEFLDIVLKNYNIPAAFFLKLFLFCPTLVEYNPEGHTEHYNIPTSN